MIICMHLTITVAVGIETDRGWSNHWHHGNGCEWELNHFDDRISELCLHCKPISAITSLATTDKQNSIIFIQANIVLASTIRNNCSSYRTWRVWHEQLLSASYLRIWCHMPRLFVNKNAWETTKLTWTVERVGFLCSVNRAITHYRYV